MPDNIFLFGASGHAKVVIDIIENQKRYNITGIYDDDLTLCGKEVLGCKVIGGKKELVSAIKSGNIKYGIVTIGNNRDRKKTGEWIISQGLELATAIHPSATIARTVLIGDGTVIMAGTVINANVSIGQNVIVNTSATIDHDCHIENNVHIGPGSVLCGSVSVGNCTLIGAGSTVLPNMKIGKNVIVAAGGTVVSGIPDGLKVRGTPTKQM